MMNSSQTPPLISVQTMSDILLLGVMGSEPGDEDSNVEIGMKSEEVGGDGDVRAKMTPSERGKKVQLGLLGKVPVIITEDVRRRESACSTSAQCDRPTS